MRLRSDADPAGRRACNGRRLEVQLGSSFELGVPGAADWVVLARQALSVVSGEVDENKSGVMDMDVRGGAWGCGTSGHGRRFATEAPAELPGFDLANNVRHSVRFVVRWKI